MAYPKAVSDTFFASWPDALKQASVPHEEIPISPEDVLALAANTPEFCEQFGIFNHYGLSEEFRDTISKGLEKFKDGAFPRLDYCSWKTSCLLNAPAKSLGEVEAIVLQPNQRVASALMDPVINNTGANFYLRKWVDIPRWSEFRIFMRDRKIIGVSQYYTDEQFPALQENLDKIREALIEFCLFFYKESHLDTVVADVFLANQNEKLQAQLIELNPFLNRTDPCLYNWEKSNFDGKLRFIAGDRVLAAPMAN
ncbi:Cell division cycle protein 123 (plasmid) [Pseudovibrio sp. FO-BEG1]|uniref:Cell division cycle protein 123 n=1 Tax=Pseudovibrio sp. (strain FO-BEG1) TaxID=911045 RepID=UPI000238C90E|nr:Cell division cycle protein 123 [Pseudovibrio sp. FO-BEG1]AEV39699.1 Cell division cycle protein 123 [Pseudovibrio sp. FO-BEG1]